MQTYRFHQRMEYFTVNMDTVEISRWQQCATHVTQKVETCFLCTVEMYSVIQCSNIFVIQKRLQRCSNV